MMLKALQAEEYEENESHTNIKAFLPQLTATFA